MAKNEYKVITSSPLEAEILTKALLSGGFKCRQADIYYCLHTYRSRIENDDSCPLVLSGFMNGLPAKIKIYNLTAGFAGAGSSAMASILEAAGFEFNINDIIYNRKVDKKTGCVKITYTRKL